jgi:hypothetical protein
MGTINQALRNELLAMAAEDLKIREELAADGSLFEGYHPRMEMVHRKNAARLREIIDANGWPGHRLAGEKGARAAWLIAQHAIGEPDFQRACLVLLETASNQRDVPPWQPAYLDDRIRLFEGRLQRYGTQYEVSEDGTAVANNVEDPDTVDERRADVGLEPLAARLARVPRTDPPDPARRAKREQNYLEWLRRVGWRK